MTWAKNLDYDETFKALSFALTSTAKEMRRYHKPARKSKIAILLIALRNGSRCSEAIDAFHQFLKDGNREQQVRVRKRGFEYERLADGTRRRKNPGGEPEEPIFRLMVIPDRISQSLPRYRGRNSGMTAYAKREFNFTPHALRHCYCLGTQFKWNR